MPSMSAQMPTSTMSTTIVASGQAMRTMPSTMPMTPRRSSSFQAAVSRSLGTSTSGSSTGPHGPFRDHSVATRHGPLWEVAPTARARHPGVGWRALAVSRGVGEAQASTVSSRRLRVRV